MNEIFNLKRFGLLLKEQIHKNLKLFIMGSIVVFAVLCALNIIGILSSSNHELKFDDRLGFYGFILFPLGILFSGFWFAKIHKTSPEIGNLLLPASHFEKIGIAFIINVLIFFILYLLIVVSVDFLLFQDADIFMYVIRIDKIFNFYLTFFALQSVYLFGSIYFKKLAPIKTSIVIFVICIVLQIIHLIILSYVFKKDNVTHFGDFFFGGNYFYKAPDFYDKILEILFLYVCFPIFWIASYFKLKEKEV